MRHDPPVHPGNLVVIEPEAMVAGGDAIARIDGFPLFIRSVYPGDRVRVEITEVKKGFGRGELVELLRPSRERREEPCPIADECGGCDWTSLRLDAQLRAKRSILVDSLRRIGKFDPADLPPVTIHPSPLNYRLRSRLHATGDPDPSIGFFALRSNRVVPIVTECEVVGPRTMENLRELTDFAREERAPSIEVFESEQEVAAATAGKEEQAVEVSIAAGAFRYRLSTDAFFQVNRHLLGTLLDLVVRSARQSSRKSLAFDLYAGVGFFTLPLAQEFERVVAVESSPVAGRWTALNSRPYPNVATVQGRVERFLERRRERADFVMVDPPRAGLDSRVIDGLEHLRPERICHLSCDPVTFSRDALRLRRAGWKLASLDLVDLFPNTHHIETLSSFILEG